MNLIGAALGHYADDAAAATAILRVIGTRLDLELFHGFGRGHVGDGIAAAVDHVVGSAIHEEFHVPRCGAVD